MNTKEKISEQFTLDKFIDDIKKMSFIYNENFVRFQLYELELDKGKVLVKISRYFCNTAHEILIIILRKNSLERESYVFSEPSSALSEIEFLIEKLK